MAEGRYSTANVRNPIRVMTIAHQGDQPALVSLGIETLKDPDEVRGDGVGWNLSRWVPGASHQASVKLSSPRFFPRR